MDLKQNFVYHFVENSKLLHEDVIFSFIIFTGSGVAAVRSYNGVIVFIRVIGT